MGTAHRVYCRNRSDWNNGHKGGGLWGLNSLAFRASFRDLPMGRRNNWNVRSSPWDLHCPLVSLSNTLMLIQLYHCLETCWYFVMLHIYRGVGFYHSCSWEKVELLLKIHPLLSGLDLNGVSTVYISSVAIQFSDTVRSASSISLSCTTCKRVDRLQISLWPLHQLVTYKITKQNDIQRRHEISKTFVSMRLAK